MSAHAWGKDEKSPRDVTRPGPRPGAVGSATFVMWAATLMVMAVPLLILVDQALTPCTDRAGTGGERAICAWIVWLGAPIVGTIGTLGLRSPQRTTRYATPLAWLVGLGTVLILLNAASGPPG